MRMIPLARIFMFIERCAIKTGKRKFIGREMSTDPVDDHSNPFLMEMVDKVLKIFWRAKAACRGIIAAHLVAPRFIERMLADRHELGMAKTHLFAIGGEFMRQMPVAEIFFPR